MMMATINERGAIEMLKSFKTLVQNQLHPNFNLKLNNDCCC